MNHFNLVLFALDRSLAQSAKSAGIAACIVDWECREKADRQKNFNTQINYQTPEDLSWVAKHCNTHVICRINGFWEKTFDEIDLAMNHGAKEILLPMVRKVEEVQRVLDYVDGRVGVGILVETLEALKITKKLGKLPLSRVYIGLNDLAIELKATHIFTPIVDGTIEALRDDFTVPFGFGGVTLIGYGHPIPTALFLAEMIRLRCDFSFLRRSFIKDLEKTDMAQAIGKIQKEVERFRKRDIHEVLNDRRTLLSSIGSLSS